METTYIILGATIIALGIIYLALQRTSRQMQEVDEKETETPHVTEYYQPEQRNRVTVGDGFRFGIGLFLAGVLVWIIPLLLFLPAIASFAF